MHTTDIDITKTHTELKTFKSIPKDGYLDLATGSCWQMGEVRSSRKRLYFLCKQFPSQIALVSNPCYIKIFGILSRSRPIECTQYDGCQPIIAQ